MADGFGQPVGAVIDCSGLRHIRALAEDYGAVFEALGTGEASVRVAPHEPGCAPGVPFLLKLSVERGRVRIREAGEGGQLPAACPQRHINHDGSFCLGWREEDPSFVSDEEGARSWWQSLLSFLDQQRYADARRRWPRGQERAHGDAARHQATAESCAASLGTGFLADLRSGAMVVRRGSSQSLILERGGRRTFAMRAGAPKVANLRAACPCTTSEERLVLKVCGGRRDGHADVARRLIEAMVEQERAEAEFNREFARVSPCCGTMDACPIASMRKLASEEA